MGSETLETIEKTMTTTWDIAGGCLEEVLTCESSLTATDSNSDSDSPKAGRLILRRPSPDSGPCEITIAFTHQHDIKQIYVQSSARVYEVYSAPNHTSGNEYLCTVRCGIADQLHSHTASNGVADAWVDVNFNNPSQTSMLHIIQDRFEATAQISDGDPVISLTLRLLSIQTPDYVCIDQLYVFADPLLSPQTPSSAPSLETMSGASMLSMFIPTLMQLSSSRIKPDADQHSTAPAVTSTNIVQNTAFVHQPNHLLHTQNPPNKPHCTKGENDFHCGKIEQSLNDLVSRVTKIEAFCLRFEETMLKPIINMETRLERIEQQLESSIKNLQLPRTGYTRYSAPEFSCNESESNSICIVANDCPATLRSESSKKDDCCPPELGIPNSDAHLQSSISASQPHPGLIISAPEFSSIEEEEINSKEDLKDSPKILKKPMSIDDALASALAGFATAALTKPIEHTATVEGAEMVSEAEGCGSTSSSVLSAPLATQLESTELVEEAEMFSGLATEKEYLTVVSVGKEIIEAVDGKKGTLYQGGSSDCSAADSLGETENKGSTAGSGCIESDDNASQAFIKDSCDSLLVIDSALLKDVESSSSAEGIPKACPAVLQDIMKLSSAARVDFSAAALDVKFSSSENASGKSSFESLLGDMLGLEYEVACVRDAGANSIIEQYDLVVIEDEGSGDVESVNTELLYGGDYDPEYMRSETELQDSSNLNHQYMSSNPI